MGWTWAWWLPINKALWEQLLVLMADGANVFGCCYWLIDIKVIGAGLSLWQFTG
jgi:predicted acyltransferase